MVFSRFVKRPNPLAVCSELRNAPGFQMGAAYRLMLERAEKFCAKHFSLSVRETWIIIAASAAQMPQGAIADTLGVNRNVMVIEMKVGTKGLRAAGTAQG